MRSQPLRNTRSSIGTSVNRRDGADKVRGHTLYTGDIRLPGTLHGAILRSPLPYARIKRIDVSAARAAPGVHAVLIGLDIPDRLAGRSLADVPVLCRDPCASSAIGRPRSRATLRKLPSTRWD